MEKLWCAGGSHRRDFFLGSAIFESYCVRFWTFLVTFRRVSIITAILLRLHHVRRPDGQWPLSSFFLISILHLAYTCRSYTTVSRHDQKLPRTGQFFAHSHGYTNIFHVSLNLPGASTLLTTPVCLSSRPTRDTNSSICVMKCIERRRKSGKRNGTERRRGV